MPRSTQQLEATTNKQCPSCGTENVIARVTETFEDLGLNIEFSCRNHNCEWNPIKSIRWDEIYNYPLDIAAALRTINRRLASLESTQHNVH